MSKIIVPKGYKSYLTQYETQEAIGYIKGSLLNQLSMALNLKRVTAPIFVDPNSGLNDDLNGVERAVTFDIPDAKLNGAVVHSLAKWKRMALYRYQFKVHKGIIADMNAIRRDEELDNLHSCYVDQYDWEKVITKEDRTISYLKDTVQRIVTAICNTLDEVKYNYEKVDVTLERNVKFITSQELEDMYPNLTPKERENAIVKEFKTVFIIGIGDTLKSGKKHDGRAPDYDDWKLNGDLLFYHKTLDTAMEISSMGIRVDSKSLDSQLTKANCDYRRNLPYHKMLLNGELPYTIGGGIGQSRICMLLLGKAHIGEVQASLWDDETLRIAKENNIDIL